MIRMRGKKEATCRVMFVTPLSECIRHPYTLFSSFFLPSLDLFLSLPFLPLSFSLCICLSLPVSHRPSPFLSPSLALTLFISLYLSVSFFLCLSLYLSVCLSYSLSLLLSISLSLFRPFALSLSRDLDSREIVYICITINQRKARGE